MKSRIKKYVLFVLLILVVILVAVILMFRSKMSHVMETKEITNEYKIEWEEEKYKGHYNGEYSNSKPNGTGIFTSEDGAFSYEGSWKNGKFDGKGTITYENNTWEIGEYKKGKRNGLCRIYTEDDAFVENYYNMGVPYGKVSKYENGNITESDLYINAILVSELKNEAEELNPKALQETIYGEQYIYVEGKVAFVGEDDKHSYFRIDSEQVGMIIGSYRNVVGNKEKQAFIPEMKKGDRVRIYGYCVGTKKNNVLTDKGSYKYDYIQIEPFYGENLSSPIDDLKSDSYEMHKKYPYASYGENIEDEFEVINSVRSGKMFYVQCKLKSATDSQEQYTLVYKGDINEIFMTGEVLHVKGYYDGQYKRLKDSEWTDYNKHTSTREMIYTYLYDVYPAIHIKEVQR